MEAGLHEPRLPLADPQVARNRGGAFDRPPYCLVIVMA